MEKVQQHAALIELVLLYINAKETPSTSLIENNNNPKIQCLLEVLLKTLNFPNHGVLFALFHLHHLHRIPVLDDLDVVTSVDSALKQLVQALIFSDIYLNDYTIPLKIWTRLTNIPNPCLKRMKRAAIDYKISVSLNDYKKWLLLFRNTSNQILFEESLKCGNGNVRRNFRERPSSF
jgi:hypothetical protein